MSTCLLQFWFFFFFQTKAKLKKLLYSFSLFIYSGESLTDSVVPVSGGQQGTQSHTCTRIRSPQTPLPARLPPDGSRVPCDVQQVLAGSVLNIAVCTSPSHIPQLSLPATSFPSQ